MDGCEWASAGRWDIPGWKWVGKGFRSGRQQCATGAPHPGPPRISHAGAAPRHWFLVLLSSCVGADVGVDPVCKAAHRPWFLVLINVVLCWR